MIMATRSVDVLLRQHFRVPHCARLDDGENLLEDIVNAMYLRARTLTEVDGKHATAEAFTRGSKVKVPDGLTEPSGNRKNNACRTP